MTKSSRSLTAWSLFLGIALLQAGVGLQRPLLGLRAEAAGFGALTASLVMTAYYAGFILGTRYTGKLLSEVGHIRTFAGLASTASSIVLFQGLWVSPLTWGDSGGRHDGRAILGGHFKHRRFHTICGCFGTGLNVSGAYCIV